MAEAKVQAVLRAPEVLEGFLEEEVEEGEDPSTGRTPEPVELALVVRFGSLNIVKESYETCDYRS